MLSENATAVAISQSLAEGTIKAERLFAAGKAVTGVLSGQAVALAEGVLKTMFLTKLKIVAAVLLVAGVAGSGAGVLTYGGVAGEQKDPQAEKLPTPPADEPQGVKPPPAIVRTRDDKLKSTAQKPDAEGKQKPLPLAAARNDLMREEARYEMQEREWMREMVDARLRMMQAEDKLRRTEREQDTESGMYSQLKAARDTLEQAEREYTNKYHPNLELQRDAVRKLEQRYNRIEGQRASILRQARMELLEAEENIRLLERSQEFQREKARRRLEAADERILQLEQGSSRVEPAKRSTSELETKVR